MVWLAFEALKMRDRILNRILNRINAHKAELPIAMLAFVYVVYVQVRVSADIANHQSTSFLAVGCSVKSTSL